MTQPRQSRVLDVEVCIQEPCVYRTDDGIAQVGCWRHRHEVVKRRYVAEDDPRARLEAAARVTPYLRSMVSSAGRVICASLAASDFDRPASSARGISARMASLSCCALCLAAARRRPWSASAFLMSSVMPA